jgi:hypothetical protein
MISRFIAYHLDYGATVLICQVYDRRQHAFHGFLMLEGLSGSHGPVSAEYIDLDDPLKCKSALKAFGVAAAYGVLRCRRKLNIHDVITMITLESDGVQKVIAKATFAGVGHGAQQDRGNGSSAKKSVAAESGYSQGDRGRLDPQGHHFEQSNKKRCGHLPVFSLRKAP